MLGRVRSERAEPPGARCTRPSDWCQSADRWVTSEGVVDEGALQVVGSDPGCQLSQEPLVERAWVGLRHDGTAWVDASRVQGIEVFALLASKIYELWVERVLGTKIAWPTLAAHGYRLGR